MVHARIFSTVQLRRSRFVQPVEAFGNCVRPLCPWHWTHEEGRHSVQRANLLHFLGPSLQRLFTILPDNYETLDEARQALENYSLKGNVVSEWNKFRSRGQRPDETIDTYLTALRELTKTCEFGLVEETIRDQIVEKCTSNSLRQKLLQHDNLD